jgi:phage terminase large subunit-like protein
VSWNLSCPDWQERIKAGRSLVPELPLWPGGERAVGVFNKLRLADVVGTPTMQEAGGDWFRDIVRALFGSLDPVTKQRLISELFLLVPKKNSKTTNGALLMLTALLLNERPRAPFILTAPVQDTADLAFAAVEGAVRLDNVLHKKLHVREHLKTIIHRETKAELEIMSFDPAVVTGRKVAGALIDELHVIAKMKGAASSIRQLRGGMVPFPEAFLAFITTQSEEAPTGVFRAELMKARAIRDGRHQAPMLPVLYEFPEAMQRKALDGSMAWRDPANWPMVTPNLGRSITIEKLQELLTDAEQKGEEELRQWASQHLNVEIGLALLSDGWTGALFWEEQGRLGVTLETILQSSEVVTVGIDGGGLDDLLGLAVVGRDRETKEWLSWAHGWAHKIVLERRKSEAARLQDFADDGDLTIVKQIGEDVTALAAIVARIHKAGLLYKVGLDPAGIGQILDALVAAKVPQKDAKGEPLIVGIKQGWQLNSAIKTAERKLAEGGLVHGGRRMMAWCVGNAKVEPRGNAILITKQASGTAKIDPLMALLNAVQLMSLNPAAAAKKFQAFTV